MKTIIRHTAAKVRGRTAQRNHRKIVDNVFATRDALDASAAQMTVEMEENFAAIGRLQTRNKELARSRSHARQVAGRIAEFFLPR